MRWEFDPTAAIASGDPNLLQWGEGAGARCRQSLGTIGRSQLHCAAHGDVRCCQRNNARHKESLRCNIGCVGQCRGARLFLEVGKQRTARQPIIIICPNRIVSANALYVPRLHRNLAAALLYVTLPGGRLPTVHRHQQHPHRSRHHAARALLVCPALATMFIASGPPAACNCQCRMILGGFRCRRATTSAE